MATKLTSEQEEIFFNNSDFQALHISLGFNTEAAILYLIDIDELTIEELQDLDYVRDRLLSHSEEFLKQ